MKHIFSLIALLFFCNLLSAHDIHYNNAVLHEWTIKNTDKSLFASYCMSKNGEVFLQKKNSEIVKLPLKDLSEKDKSSTRIYRKYGSPSNTSVSWHGHADLLYSSPKKTARIFGSFGLWWHYYISLCIHAKNESGFK